MQEEYRKTFLLALRETRAIDFESIVKITDSFQIASGHSHAIGMTKALMDFLKQGNDLEITDSNSNRRSLLYMNLSLL